MSLKRNEYLSYAQGDRNFAEWLSEVDGIVMSTAGLSIFDLPDVAYRDMYEDRYNIREAAEQALSEAGFPGYRSMRAAKRREDYEDYLDWANDDIMFATWLSDVDDEFQEEIGMSMLDALDYDERYYIDLYRGDKEPEDVASWLIEKASIESAFRSVIKYERMHPSDRDWVSQVYSELDKIQDGLSSVVMMSPDNTLNDVSGNTPEDAASTIAYDMGFTTDVGAITYSEYAEDSSNLYNEMLYAIDRARKLTKNLHQTNARDMKRRAYQAVNGVLQVYNEWLAELGNEIIDYVDDDFGEFNRVLSTIEDRVQRMMTVDNYTIPDSSDTFEELEREAMAHLGKFEVSFKECIREEYPHIQVKAYRKFKKMKFDYESLADNVQDFIAQEWQADSWAERGFSSVYVDEYRDNQLLMSVGVTFLSVPDNERDAYSWASSYVRAQLDVIARDLRSMFNVTDYEVVNASSSTRDDMNVEVVLHVEDSVKNTTKSYNNSGLMRLIREELDPDYIYLEDLLMQKDKEILEINLQGNLSHEGWTNPEMLHHRAIEDYFRGFFEGMLDDIEELSGYDEIDYVMALTKDYEAYADITVGLNKSYDRHDVFNQVKSAGERSIKNSSALDDVADAMYDSMESNDADFYINRREWLDKYTGDTPDMYFMLAAPEQDYRNYHQAYDVIFDVVTDAMPEIGESGFSRFELDYDGTQDNSYYFAVHFYTDQIKRAKSMKYYDMQDLTELIDEELGAVAMSSGTTEVTRQEAGFLQLFIEGDLDGSWPDRENTELRHIRSFFEDFFKDMMPAIEEVAGYTNYKIREVSKHPGTVFVEVVVELEKRGAVRSTDVSIETDVDLRRKAMGRVAKALGVKAVSMSSIKGVIDDQGVESVIDTINGMHIIDRQTLVQDFEEMSKDFREAYSMLIGAADVVRSATEKSVWQSYRTDFAPDAAQATNASSLEDDYAIPLKRLSDACKEISYNIITR